MFVGDSVKIFTIFSFLILVFILGCQPLSSKKNSSGSKTSLSKNIKRDDSTNSVHSPVEADTQYIRRKIPTLREQMERVQAQQDVTNSKIDSLRNEFNELKKDFREGKALGTSKLPENQNFKGDPVIKREPEVPAEQMSTEFSKPLKKKSIPKDEKPGKGLPKSNNSKTNDIILPDDVSEDSSPKIKGKKKQPINNDVILPDNDESLHKKSSKELKNTESIIVSKKTPNTSSEKVFSEVKGKVLNSTNTNIEKSKIDNDVDLLYNSAISLYGKRQYQEAIDLMSQVINSSTSPEKTAAANFYIGRSYFAQNKYDDALTNLDKVVKAKNSAYVANSLGLIGECYLKKGNINEAKKFYKKIQSQYPNSEAIVLANKRLQQY